MKLSIPNGNLPLKIHPRKKPSQRRAENRLAAILAAYRRLLNGDARRITTTIVAREAGIPVSSVYQYFPNKEAIAFAVYREWAEEAIRILRKRCEDADSAIHWQDFLENYKTDFFARISSARIVRLLGPVMEGSPELKIVQQRYQTEIVRIVAETLRKLGSDWPGKPLNNIVSLLIDLNTATFRRMAQQSSPDARETNRNWEVAGRALLKRCVETPFKQVVDLKGK